MTIWFFCHCTDISLYFLITWLFWNGLSLMTLKSEEITLSSGSFNGGVILPLVSKCFSMHCYFLMFSYKLTISNGLSFMPLKSEEFTLSSNSFDGGSFCLWYLNVSLCTAISLCFLISWLFQMDSHLCHWRAKSSLCPLAVVMGGRTIRALHLPNLSSQTFRFAHQKGLFASHKTNETCSENNS